MRVRPGTGRSRFCLSLCLCLCVPNILPHFIKLCCNHALFGFAYHCRLIVDHFTGSLTSVIECRGFCEGYVASILKQILLGERAALSCAVLCCAVLNNVAPRMSGVAHLHSVGVVHRHLTPDNVLLNIVHPNKVMSCTPLRGHVTPAVADPTRTISGSPREAHRVRSRRRSAGRGGPGAVREEPVQHQGVL